MRLCGVAHGHFSGSAECYALSHDLHRGSDSECDDVGYAIAIAIAV
ncbi:hypothetical protein [Nonomuraea sp. B19D2]